MKLIPGICTLVLLLSCDKNEIEDTAHTTNDETFAIYEKIYRASDIYSEVDMVVIKTKGTFYHQSPYYMNTERENGLYKAYSGSSPQFHLNPNSIAGEEPTYKIPLNL